jgi:hypothetical protein
MSDNDEESKTPTGTTPTPTVGLLPSKICETINQFNKLIVWKQVGGFGKTAEVPEPQRGIDDEFDAANDTVDAIKKELDAHLKGI